MRKYYVYEWFNIETGYVFYVGKGMGRRVNQIQKSRRNRYFIRYIKKHNCSYRMLKADLTEQEALKYENEVILKYRKTKQCCCNLDDGGRNGGKAVGEKNGMYGKTHSDEVKKILKEINSDGRHKGEKNSQYKVSPKDRMDEATYNTWREKQHARKFGESNPNYGNTKLSEIYQANPQYAKEKQSRPKAQNGRAKVVFLYTTDMKFIKQFDCVIECAEYLALQKASNSTPKVIATGIYSAVFKNKPYLKHIYSYEKLH